MAVPRLVLGALSKVLRDLACQLTVMFSIAALLFPILMPRPPPHQSFHLHADSCNQKDGKHHRVQEAVPPCRRQPSRLDVLSAGGALAHVAEVRLRELLNTGDWTHRFHSAERAQ